MAQAEDARIWRGRSVALVLLAFTAGSMDAIAFLSLGEVFTSAMSGNTVLFGLALGEGRMLAASHSLVAFIGYVIGVAGAVLPLAARARAIERALALEALFLAAFAALWFASAGPGHVPAVYILILLSAIGMGIQGAVGRSVQEPGISTIVFTSTLTAIVGTLSERAFVHRQPLLTPLARRQIETFGIYFASAVLTGFAVLHRIPGMPVVPVAAVVALIAGLRLGWLRL